MKSQAVCICALLAATQSVTGCCKDEASKAPATAAPDGYVSVPNANGLQVKPPAGSVENGPGGAWGFHTTDDSFDFNFRKVEPPLGTFDESKKDKEALLFKKWIRSEKTADGWILVHEAPKIDLASEKETGSFFAIDVRKKLGESSYTCSGSVAKQADVQKVVDACQSLRAE